ncbi:MAG TPA: hypothetical protein VFO40_04910 [Chthoniobacterales bacterium]|nr:hypothetical protein [Chthoniobacterales bacterium]
MKKYERKFARLPIREARASLHVQPNKWDIKDAVKEDPENCAYARCLRRTLECQHVFVFKTVAYIETLDEKGRPVMQRYIVRHYAREYLLRFDGGEKVEPGGFVFHAPNRSRTLNYKVEHYRGRPRSPHARLTGETVQPKSYSLRNGKGQVHFSGLGVITKSERPISR